MSGGPDSTAASAAKSRAGIRTVSLADKVDAATQSAAGHLLSLQKAGGYWCGELGADSTLCSDYVMFMHWADEVEPQIEARCVKHILRRQLPDGGWSIYAGGPSEVNATVKAYFALKLAGHAANADHMRDARATILRLGGIPAMHTYGKFYLALMGQFPWKYVPTIPVEMVLFPAWLFFNIYEMSQWSRPILVPMSIISHYKPTHPLPEEKCLHELYPAGTEQSDFSLKRDKHFFSWRNFFLCADKLLKKLHRFRINKLRVVALQNAEAWMLDRMGPESDGLGAVYPSMLNARIALKCMGYQDTEAVVQKAKHDFEGLFVDDPDDFRIQPCVGPLWDTAINLVTLSEAGVPLDTPALKKAVDWVLEREVRFRGDWRFKNPYPHASGWAFEFRNDHYPDTDDTMMVLMGLRFFRHRGNTALDQAFDRALPWLLSFQCSDGGWAAFDRDVSQAWLEDVPFADHKAILDPTCSDLTARVLELLGSLGYSMDEPLVPPALNFLKKTQEADGSWYGRWGVAYLYGTWQALRGLASIGQDMSEDWILRARDWLESCQNDDGGWGETPAAYEDPHLKGKGPSTASQSAWALMGLIACGDVQRMSIQRGIQYLIDTQDAEGGWKEEWITGTGFPKVFYLRYDMYRLNWPTLALATYRKESAAREH